MNLVEKNIVNFIDALIVDDYSTAHKFLENIVNEKVKGLISEAVSKEHPFKKTNKSKKDKTSEKSKKSKSVKLDFKKFKKGEKKK
jgi:predicted GIY-YIG superfamily endonuclease